MDAKELADFLQDNPDFFEHHPEILDRLSLPNPHGEGTISLAERQLSGLREKTRQLEAKLAELIRFGEENDELGGKVHQFSVELMQAADYEAVHAVTLNNLRERFAVPFVAMRLWNTVLQRDGREFEPVSEETRFFAGDLSSPYCGTPTSQEMSAWFGETVAPHVRSVCLVALRRDAQVFGLLAMGSGEAKRFYPEMGTLYVERIGELLAGALLRQLG